MGNVGLFGCGCVCTIKYSIQDYLREYAEIVGLRKKQLSVGFAGVGKNGSILF
jgi:hypothetical protein